MTGVGILLGGCGGAGDAGPRAAADPPPPSLRWRGAMAGVELQLQADRSVVRVGEDVRIELAIRNLSGGELALTPPMREVLSRLEILVFNLSAMIRLAVEPELAVGGALPAGAELRYAAKVPAERLRLYSTPPAGGGMHRQLFVVSGPSLPGTQSQDVRGNKKLQELHVAYLRMLASGQIEIALQADFGPGPALAADYGEIELRFKPGTAVERVEEIIRKHGLYVRRSIPNWIVYAPADRTVANAARALAAEPDVEAAKGAANR